MNSTNPPCWEAPKFSFTTEDQPAEWKKFYICALDYLETLDIDPEKKDENKRGWCQIKMMFQDDDRQTLQDLIDNNTITAEDQLTPTRALQAIQRNLKEDKHFWNFRDELLSDFRQEPNEGTHSHSNRINNLINNCMFTDSNTTVTLKIMLLAHAIKYHEARDWIRLQNQSTLTYQSLLAHCKLLEQRCEQYQKAQLRGRAELTTITVAASVTSPVHQDTVTTHKNQTAPDVDITILKAVAQHLDNNVITVADLDTIQLYVKNQGLPNNTIALADLLQEDLVADIAADQ